MTDVEAIPAKAEVAFAQNLVRASVGAHDGLGALGSIYMGTERTNYKYMDAYINELREYIENKI